MCLDWNRVWLNGQVKKNHTVPYTFPHGITIEFEIGKIILLRNTLYLSKLCCANIRLGNLGYFILIITRAFRLEKTVLLPLLYYTKLCKSIWVLKLKVYQSMGNCYNMQISYCLVMRFCNNFYMTAVIFIAIYNWMLIGKRNNIEYLFSSLCMEFTWN